MTPRLESDPTELSAPAPRRSRARLLAAFRRDEDGSLIIFSLFMFVLMIMISGMSLDIERFETARTKLQATADGAALSGASLTQNVYPLKDVVEDYFDKAGMSAFIDNDSITVKSELNFRRVTVDADINVPTHFFNMIGIENLATTVSSVAEESIGEIEVSLVLDISGSMRFGGRINNLKPAAKEFVTEIMSGTADHVVSVNLVTYAGQTNPGPLMFDYLGGDRWTSTPASVGDAFPEWPQTIEEVVLYFDDDNDGDIDQTILINDFPASGDPDFVSNDLDTYFGDLKEFAVHSVNALGNNDDLIGVVIHGGSHGPYYYRYENNSNGPIADSKPSGIRLNYRQRDIDATLDYDDFYALNTPSCLELDPSTDFLYAGLPNAGSYDQVPEFMYWDIAADVMDWGWCPDDDQPIRYGQTDEAALHGYIDSLRMHDGTGTHYAMRYALALLDPGTRAAFNMLAAAGEVPNEVIGRPLDWNDPDGAKFIVLMTDGRITDQWRPEYGMNDRNLDTELAAQGSSNRYRLTSENNNVTNFYRSCDLAKANGVRVYTIAFEVDGAGENEMRNCASTPSHFFDVRGTQISQAFAAIAADINRLRLTQ